MKTIRELIEDGSLSLDTKVAGDIHNLPKTDDGAIECPGFRSWHLFDDGSIVQEDRFGNVRHPTYGEFGGHHRPRYSTPEAAAAARKAGA